MSPIVRAVFGLVVQAGLLALAVYLVASPDALPGAPLFVRVGLGVLSAAVVMLYGEVMKVRADFSNVLSALRSSISGNAERDDREAIDILVAKLGSQHAEVRETAHKHLVRLTGQDLPLEPQRWVEWWRAARPGCPRCRRGGPA